MFTASTKLGRILRDSAATDIVFAALPWLAGSLILAEWPLYPLALALSFVFFLTGLRIVHGAFHYTLGLPRRATDLLMFCFSLAMLGSMHAVQWNHPSPVIATSDLGETRWLNNVDGKWFRPIDTPVGSPAADALGNDVRDTDLSPGVFCTNVALKFT